MCILAGAGKVQTFYCQVLCRPKCTVRLVLPEYVEGIWRSSQLSFKFPRENTEKQIKIQMRRIFFRSEKLWNTADSAACSCVKMRKCRNFVFPFFKCLPEVNCVSGAVQAVMSLCCTVYSIFLHPATGYFCSYYTFTARCCFTCRSVKDLKLT